jgi:peptide/nickel transport system substrate-binding protein
VPDWPSGSATTNHGYLIYDTLFALDAEYRVQPQMVSQHDVSDDDLTHIFTLRDGLAFHNGQPVRAEDCIASIQRWSRRDVFGAKLAEIVEAYDAVGDTAFRIRLKRPFPLLTETFAKPGSNVLFIMPARVAATDPFKQITDTTGSGPFILKNDEFVAAHKAVYVRNPNYVARQEPPSFAAGGKIAKVDRIEVLYMPDPQRQRQPCRMAR